LLSGNPSKFLQGHNVFGSDHLIDLVYDTYRVICQTLSLQPTLADLKAVKEGDYVIKNIDINYSFELPTRGDVLAWLRAMEYKSKTRHGRPSSRGGTLYFGQGTSRWKIKAYCKGEELEAGKKHGLPEALRETPLKDWANNKLRVEVTLLKKELQENEIGKARDLTVSRIQELYSQYIRRIEMNEQVALTGEVLEGLPLKYQSTYLHWLNGVDLRSVLTKPTYYRHRKALLEYGIDIALRREAAKRSNVVPLIRVLEARPAEIPSWAYEKGLIHRSAQAC
jgi:II/X family phage/plasmid replication protein